VGGRSPRGADEMVVAGPYKVGQASHVCRRFEHLPGTGLPGSVVGFFSVFCIYFVLIILLIRPRKAPCGVRTANDTWLIGRK